MNRVKEWFKRKFTRTQPIPPPEPPPELVERYHHYKRLLSSNNAILTILADLQDKMSKEFLFDMNYVRSAVGKVGAEAETLVKALVNMAQGSYGSLETALKEVLQRIEAETAEPQLKPGPLILPLEEVKEGAFFGGKAETPWSFVPDRLAGAAGFCHQRLCPEAVF